MQTENLEWEKKSCEIRKVPLGGQVAGVYLGTSEREWLDKEDGEVKIITQVHMRELETEVEFIVFADGGLKNSMQTANLTPGDRVKFERASEKAALKGARTVNQWTIFKAKALKQ